jgi:hypothetical protein
MRCIGEPVSWLRLEELALGVAHAGVAEHVDACPACKQCFAGIRSDLVALPPLAVPEAPRRRAFARWYLYVPAYALVAAAIVLFVMWRPSAGGAAIKGGDLSIGLVRDRGGTIREDVLTFAPGDRFKVVVTCPPRFAAWVDVGVVEDGALAADFPLVPAAIACGNRVVLPGAFTLSGARPNRVCVRVASGAPPLRTMPRPQDDDVTCVTVRPE